MDVTRLEQIAAAVGSKDRRKRRNPDELEQPETGGFGSGGGGFGGGGHDVEDDISVMGIPREEITPAVERAVTLLLEEINHLRTLLDRSKGHEAYLEQHADEHPFLPVINRRALVGRLNQMLVRARENKTSSAFIYLHVGNAEEARTQFGHEAEEALLLRVADGLHDIFGNDALIGSMDSADFGIVLPVMNQDGGRERMDSALATLKGVSCPWEGRNLSPDVVGGLYIFDGDDTAENILGAADADLLARGKGQ